MDISKLVDAITREVMKRIAEAQNNIKEKNFKILVVDSSKNDSYKKIIQKLSSSEFCVDSLDDSNQEIDIYDAIIINNIDNRELANLSLGVQCGQKENIIIQAILKGKKLYLLEEGIEYRKYADTANEVFYKMYREYENKLVSFGIDLIKESNIIAAIKDKKPMIVDNHCIINKKEEIKNQIKQELKSEFIKDMNKTNESNRELNMFDFSDKKLLLESDLRRIYKKGIKTIKVAKKIIVSPLAKDFIRINKLTLITAE